MKWSFLFVSILAYSGFLCPMLGAQFQDGKDVSYKNKPIRAWLRQLIESDGRSAYEEAHAAVTKYLSEQKDGIETVLRELGDPDQKIRWGATRALRINHREDADSFAAIKKVALGDCSADVRSEAVRTLRLVWSNSTEVQEILVQSIKTDRDPDVRSAAIFEIRRLNKPTQPVMRILEEAIKDGNRRIRMQAGLALAEVGTAERVAPLLIKTLIEDKDEEVRESVSIALADMGSRAAPFLRRALNEKPDIGRARAALALGRINFPDADARAAVRAAVPVTAELLSVSDEQVKLTAAQAIDHIAYKLHGDAEAAIPALITAITDKDSEVQNMAIVALAKFGTASEPAVPALIRCLGNKSWSIRNNAAQTLGSIGKKASAAVPDLIGLLKDKTEKPEIRRSAADGLKGIGFEASAAVPALKEALKDKDKQLQQRARRALEAINSKADTEGMQSGKP
jgi:HEAT repeat protein